MVQCNVRRIFATLSRSVHPSTYVTRFSPIVLLLILVAALANAASIGSISGVVKDTVGQGIPDASVTLEKDGGAVGTATTDAQGAYAFSIDSTGDYTVTVSKEGYGLVTPPWFPIIISEAALNQIAPDIVMSLLSNLFSSVYRFYNTATGTHFYTILESEKDLVIQTMPSFIYEGAKFYAYTDG